MAKTRLNRRQKSILELWQQQQPSKVIKIIDRTCGYRDVYLAWESQLNQPNNQIATINYQTRLELTKIGKVRILIATGGPLFCLSLYYTRKVSEICLRK